MALSGPRLVITNRTAESGWLFLAKSRWLYLANAWLSARVFAVTQIVLRSLAVALSAQVLAVTNRTAESWWPWANAYICTKLAQGLLIALPKTKRSRHHWHRGFGGNICWGCRTGCLKGQTLGLYGRTLGVYGQTLGVYGQALGV